MRHVHIRFSARELIQTKVEMSGSLPIFLLRNAEGYEIVLSRPKLKRRIIGVVIEDHWNSRERWFSDEHSTVVKAW